MRCKKESNYGLTYLNEPSLTDRKKIRTLLKRRHGLYGYCFLIIFLFLNFALHNSNFAKGLNNQKNKLEESWIAKILQKKVKIFPIIQNKNFKIELKILKETDPLSEKYGVSICWVSFPKSYADMLVKDVKKFGYVNKIFEEIKEPLDVVVVNGGFYGYNYNDEYMTLGLVISKREKKSGKISWKTGGILLQKDSLIQIAPIKSFVFDKSINNAIQSKPILVKSSQNDIYSNQHELFNRTAICLDKKNNVIVVGAFEDNGRAVSLYDFAQFLSTKNSLGNIKVEIALAMDGGPGAHLFFPIINKHFGYKGKNYIPNTIHFKIKKW